MILSQQDRLSLKCPIKMRTSLILLAGTMFHLAIPAFAYSADALLPSPNASIKSVAPESVQINGRQRRGPHRSKRKNQELF